MKKFFLLFFMLLALTAMSASMPYFDCSSNAEVDAMTNLSAAQKAIGYASVILNTTDITTYDQFKATLDAIQNGRFKQQYFRFACEMKKYKKFIDYAAADPTNKFLFVVMYKADSQHMPSSEFNQFVIDNFEKIIKEAGNSCSFKLLNRMTDIYIHNLPKISAEKANAELKLLMRCIYPKIEQTNYKKLAVKVKLALDSLKD